MTFVTTNEDMYSFYNLMITHPLINRVTKTKHQRDFKFILLEEAKIDLTRPEIYCLCFLAH